MNIKLVSNLDEICEFTDKGIYYTNVREETYFHPYGSINKIYIKLGCIVVESKEPNRCFNYAYRGKQKNEAKEAVAFADNAIKTAVNGKVRKVARKNLKPNVHQEKDDINKSEKANTNEKNQNIALILFVVLLAIAFFVTDKMILSVVLSAVLTGGLYAGFNNIIKSKKSENKKKFYAKVVIWSILLFILCSVFSSFIANYESQKCINCKKNAIYTKSGWCYSCYKDAENAVIGSNDKY